MRQETQSAADFSSLMSVIQKGVQYFGDTKALENEIYAVIAKADNRKKIVDAVLVAICKEYSINREVLINSKFKRLVKEARDLSYCILHLELGLTHRYISRGIFGKNKNNHTEVFSAVNKYRELSPNIKSDREFLDKYNKIWNHVKKQHGV